MSITCRQCLARCCRYFAFEIDKPTSYKEFENLRWYLMHEGVTIHIDLEGDWYIAISNRCKNLDARNRCRDYDNRPLICRSYGQASCDFSQGDYEYRALFTKPEQLEQYARMKLGPKRFDKIRTNARARVAKPPKQPTAGRSVKKKKITRREPLSDLFVF